MDPALFSHLSVLPREVMAGLAPQPGEVFLDGTVGGGGHARLILAATAPDGILIGLDRDPEALATAAAQLAEFGERVILRHARLSQAKEVLAELGIAAVDGILFDLGVSSWQLDAEQRGFSFRGDGPLDMRMDPTCGVTAAEVVNGEDERELARIFRELGEERWAGRIARRIVQRRATQPLATTLELAELVRDAIPGGGAAYRIHPATRVFLALRLYVNGELEEVAQGVRGALSLLRPQGRLAVISFHSLEDRIVKRIFQGELQPCSCPPGLPVCACGARAAVEAVTRKGVKASDEEIALNPRARSAVLRVVRKRSDEATGGLK